MTLIEFDFSDELPSNDSVSGYCHDRRGNIVLVWMGICGYGNDFNLVAWYLTCTNTSGLLALATFIVYSVIPELKNLNGLISRGYLGSYICCIICAVIFVSRNENESYANHVSNRIIGSAICYFALAAVLWLNVMSIDIWRTFRKFQPKRGLNHLDAKKREKKKYLLYSIYAWGVPGVYISAVIIAYFTITQEAVWVYATPFFLGILLTLIGSLTVTNVCMYTFTAIAIKKHKKETAGVVSSANKHSKKDEQWFNLYLKLFVIMGGPVLLWIAAVCLHNQTYWRIVYVVESLQGVCILYIFVWKEDVKKLLRKRFDEMLQGSCLRNG